MVLHWTVPYLLLLVAVVGGAGMALNLALLLVIVLAHEFGHSLVATRLGVQVSRISILPFGGMAHMSMRPDRPDLELRIALAGPAVNLVLALPGVLVLLAGGLGGLPDPTGGGSAMALLAWFTGVNLALGLFNLLPAFPMDGGRVLRSILVPRVGELKATEVAVRIGRWLAAGMVVTAILFRPEQGAFLFATTLLVIAVVIWALGGRELFLARLRHAAGGGGADPREAFFRMFRGQGFGPGFGQGPGQGFGGPGGPGGAPPAWGPDEPERRDAETRGSSSGGVEILGGGTSTGGGFSDEDIERLEHFHGRLPKKDDAED